jgi:hypothetical protein
MQYRKYKNRPEFFRITDAPHSLKRGLVFAGLGRVHGSTHYRDSSGRGNHGTLVGGPTWVWDGTLGRWCQQFIGANSQYINAYNGSAETLLGGYGAPLTVAIWAKASTEARQVIVGTWDSGGSNAYLVVEFGGYLQPNSQISGMVGYYSSDENYLKGPAYSIGIWNHIAIRYDGATPALFVNGVQSDTATIGADPAASSQIVAVGRAGNYNGIYLTGSVSDFLCHRRALSPSEIQQLADPSNVMLSGLIVPPRRVLWPVATTQSVNVTGPFQSLIIASA